MASLQNFTAPVGPPPPLALAQVQAQEVPPAILGIRTILVTRYLCVAWAALAICLIGSSVAAALWVPAKGEDGRLQQKKVHLADEADAWRGGPLRWLSLSWLDGLVGRYGQRLAAAPLDPAELALERWDELGRGGASFREAWSEEVKQHGLQRARVHRAVLRVLGFRTVLMITTCAWFSAFLELVGMAVALDAILARLEQATSLREANLHEGPQPLEPVLLTLGLLFVLPMLHRCFSVALSLADGHHTSQLSAAFGQLVFEKAARLPVGCGYSTGLRGDLGKEGTAASCEQRQNVAQLLCTDIIQEWTCMLKTLATFSAAPFIFLVLLLLLVYHLQMAGLLATLYLLPGLALSLVTMRRSMHHRRQYQSYQSARVQRLAEYLGSVRVVKALGLERFFRDSVGKAREGELGSCHSCALGMAFLAANAHSMTWLMALGGLFIHSLMQGGVEARHTWVVFQIVSSLQACLGLMAAGLRKAVALPSSLQRVEAFLKLPERPSDVLRAPDSRPGPAARLSGSFAFEEGSPPVLHDLNLEFARGELVAVVGSAASGKSALLQALLGELFPIGLALAVAPRRAAYCAQEPWILEASLQENVTLGQRLDPERYYSALHAASLLQDLALLPGGDQAPLGPRGASLSSSQRMRLALARAGYASQEGLALLDDPFGQLPEAVGRHIFHHLLLGPRLRESTRLVAMQPRSRLLGHFDRVVLLREGQVVEDGCPEKVLRSRAFLELLGEAEAPRQDAWPAAAPEAAAAGGGTGLGGWSCTAPVAVSVPRELVRQAVQPEPEGYERFAWATAATYIRAGGLVPLAAALLLSLLQRCTQLLESVALATWGDSAMYPGCDHRKFMVALLAFVLVNSVLLWASESASSCFAGRAARELHDRAMTSLLQAPVDRFFDKQPSGRLLSRLSADLAQLDGALAGFGLGALRGAAGTLLQQTYLLFVMPPWAALCALPVYTCVVLFGYLYRGVAISLCCCARSSLSTLQDLTSHPPSVHVSVRANGAYPMLLEKCCNALESATRANYLFLAACKSWVSLRTTLCLSLALSAFTLYALLTPDSGVGVGTLGLVASLTLALLADLEPLAELFARCTLVLGALQRVVDLLSVPKEAATDTPAQAGVLALRLVVRIPGDQVVAFAVEEGPSPPDLTLISAADGAPLLEAASEGRALKCAEGRKLQDLAPGVEALEGLGASYYVVAVGAASRGARTLAEALLQRGQDGRAELLRLELWSAACAEGGLAVRLQGLCAGYAGVPDVLRGMSFDVPPRSRTALVGPPGSGKTTTLWCLLRLIEPRRGRVLLGGLDAAGLSSKELREAVGLVPQEAAVFEGSWRLNADPLGEHGDMRVRQVLRCVGLPVKSLDEPLGTRGNCKLSNGQKHLLGLARMVLRQPPLLLLDQGCLATDRGTLEAVRSVIAAELPLSTVVAAAHEAEALRGFDRIVVLRDGEVVDQIAVSAGAG